MDLLSTSEAARLIGVGTTSVKRWADTGELECVRTAGGHRRFTRSALERFLRFHADKEPVNFEVERWIDILLSDRHHELALLQARGRLSSWFQVAAELNPVLTELGLRCERGELSIATMLIFSERLTRALAQISESLLLPSGASKCLLACVEPERHTLGLSLSEICLREIGWDSVFLGGQVPTEAVVERVRLDDRVRLVGLSASKACCDAKSLHRIQVRVASACRERDVELILGGSGPWPEDPNYGIRVFEFHQLEGLRTHLRQRDEIMQRLHRVHRLAG